MKINLNLFCTLFFSIFLNAQNFQGTVGKYPVIMHLERMGENISGYYFYEKVGVDIPLSGTDGSPVILSEPNGKFYGRFDDKLFTRTANFGSNGKQYKLALTQIDQEIPAFPKNVTGTYTSSSPDCAMTLKIWFEKSNFHYSLKTNSKNYKGLVTFSRYPGDDVYLNLEGIQWAENLGAIDFEGTEPELNSETYGIDFFVSDQDELILQNSGNAMNYYVKLGNCDQKYVYLKKTH